MANNMSTHESPLGQISVKDILQKIEGLNDELRIPFEMHFEGFKYKEIAIHLNLPIGTIKSRIFIARKKLMEQLPGYHFSAN
jgi:RNA polymerase sigma-70 factor (ECF subfamily)